MSDYSSFRQPEKSSRINNLSYWKIGAIQNKTAVSVI